MANRRRAPAGAFRALDRALGGRQRPTRIQKRVARHPIGTGLCVAVAFTLFFLLLAPEDESDHLLSAASLGLVMGVVFGLSAIAERQRQHRLKRLGIWDGS
ncbi:hypothetical protein [Streptomyces sp. NPDC057557]|uniref:hypothetical protein n=1 Tax=Streptomyces sp. NPDC057557 TaxID=3346167 RepID=UPI003683A8A1